MFAKKPSHRIFDYEPRYYKPELDEEEKENADLNSSITGKQKKE